MTIPLWVDCDPGQDDINALILAAYNRHFDLIGVSTCHGNASIEDTTRNTLMFLSAINKTDIPVYMGARHSLEGNTDYCPQVHGAHGLDKSDIIPDPPLFDVRNGSFFPALAEAIEQYGDQLCIAAIAPLTNMAQFFAAYPHLKDKFRYMTIMGGGFEEFNVNGNAEFNIFSDSVAAHQVIDDPVLSKRIIMAPLDVTTNVRCTPALQQQILDAPNEASATRFRRMMHGFLHAFYLRVLERMGPSYIGPAIHDPVAVAALLQICAVEPELGLTFKRIKVHVETTSDKDGVVEDCGPGDTIVLTAVDTNHFWKLMLKAYDDADKHAYVNTIPDDPSKLPHTEISDICHRMPKIELHCHLYGTIRQQTFLEFNAREGRPFTDDEILAFYVRGDKPVGVLKAFRTLESQLIKYPADLYQLASEYLEDAYSQNIKYTEFFWNPTGTVLGAGISYAKCQEAILDAIYDAEKSLGIVGRLICAIDREDSGARAVEMINWMVANRDPRVVGIGIDYCETNRGPELFQEAYSKARQQGYKLTAHAGEFEAPWQNVEYVLNTIHVDRIDHGYSMLHNPALVNQIVESGITVTCVPTNSYYLRTLPKEVWAKQHPIRKMIQLGVHVHTNSDDPTLHNSNPTRDWTMMYECFDASLDQLKLFSMYGIDGSWAPDELKSTLREQVNAFFDSL